MSESVDVRAVWDAYAHDYDFAHHGRFQEARTAVTELIERDARVRIVLDTWERAVDDFKGHSVARGMMALCAKELRAALQGGAK